MMKSRKQLEFEKPLTIVGSILVTKEPTEATPLDLSLLSPIIDNPKFRVFKEVVIHPDYPDQKMIHFLSTHLHNFAWCTQDMPRISPDVAEHKLNINPTFKSIK